MSAHAHNLAAFPLYAQNLEPHPLAKLWEQAFYDLIQEQAEQHAFSPAAKEREHEAEALFDAIARHRQCEAFLVMDTTIPWQPVPLTAVTYYAAHNGRGAGLYLEDIVTTKRERGRGAGSFALATLAQVALKRRFNYVAWECAAHNTVAQDFYTSHGAMSHNDQHTWRQGQVPNLNAQETDTDSGLAFRKISFGNYRPLISFLEEQGMPPHEGQRKLLSHKAYDEDPLFIVATETTKSGHEGNVVGMASAYRSFSTFRIVSGLHISSLYAQGNDPQIASSLLRQFTPLQHKRNLLGHTDITLADRQKEWLNPVIEQAGFEPLAYGEDKMIVRSLHDSALHKLACRYGNRDLTTHLRCH
ncbi:MAG: GNAT family N-acetyltransferase [Bdellovibrionales bacterium]|jgi:GNAT superfamily N-acetyltransferase